MRPRKILLPVLLAASLLALGACGGSGDSTSSAAPKSSASPHVSKGMVTAKGMHHANTASMKMVMLKGFAFSPAALTVAKGTTVMWMNEDPTSHNVVADDGAFSSANFSQGKSFSFKFDKAGKFTYTCTLHSNMKGTVTVK